MPTGLSVGTIRVDVKYLIWQLACVGRGGDRPTSMFYIKTWAFRRLKLTILASLQSSWWKAHDWSPNNAFLNLVPETYTWCDDRQLLTETEPLTRTVEVFHRWGCSGGCFFFFLLEREGDAVTAPFTGNVLTEDPTLSLPAGPCCCSAHYVGFKPGHKTHLTPEVRHTLDLLTKQLPHFLSFEIVDLACFIFTEYSISEVFMSVYKSSAECLKGGGGVSVEPRD